jgi:DNA-binding transcriptional LysR family regulator
LNLHEIEVFLAAAENSNFSDAARHLHLSQPAVSQTIQGLEKRLNVNLFERKGRRVELSDAGQALVPMARDLLASAQRVEDQMGLLQGVVAGQIALGCSTGVGKYLLPQLVKDFHNRYPQVRFDVTVCTRDSVLDLLTAGDVNMIFCSNIPKHVDVEAMPIYNDSIALIVPANHRWARVGKITPQELVGEPLIGREDSSGTSQILYETLDDLGIHPDKLNTVISLTNVEAVTLAVENSIGVAFVSRLVAQRSVEVGKVAFVELEGVDLTQTIYLVRNQRLPITLSQNTFWEYIRKERERFHSQSEQNLLDVREIVRSNGNANGHHN